VARDPSTSGSDSVSTRSAELSKIKEQEIFSLLGQWLFFHHWARPLPNCVPALLYRPTPLKLPLAREAANVTGALTPNLKHVTDVAFGGLMSSTTFFERHKIKGVCEYQAILRAHLVFERSQAA